MANNIPSTLKPTTIDDLLTPNPNQPLFNNSVFYKNPNQPDTQPYNQNSFLEGYFNNIKTNPVNATTPVANNSLLGSLQSFGSDAMGVLGKYGGTIGSLLGGVGGIYGAAIESDKLDHARDVFNIERARANENARLQAQLLNEQLRDKFESRLSFRGTPSDEYATALAKLMDERQVTPKNI